MSRNLNQNNVATLEPDLAQERLDCQNVTEFSLWLDEQLELLEAKYEDYTTSHSVLMSLTR